MWIGRLQGIRRRLLVSPPDGRGHSPLRGKAHDRPRTPRPSTTRPDRPSLDSPLDEVPCSRQEARQTHVLVVAGSTSSFPAGSAHADVLVVAPALNSWLRQWLSDETPLAVGRRSGWPHLSGSCSEPSSRRGSRRRRRSPLGNRPDAVADLHGRQDRERRSVRRRRGRSTISYRGRASPSSRPKRRARSLRSAQATTRESARAASVFGGRRPGTTSARCPFP